MQRLSKSGALLLGACLYGAYEAFNRTLYGEYLRSVELAASSSVALNGIVMALSLLSVLSHVAVVLGALSKASLLMIAMGLAFDVLTRTVQLVWWMELSVISLVEGAVEVETSTAKVGEYILPTLCLFLAPMMFVYHSAAHVKMLQKARRLSDYSYLEVVDLLCTALMNLLGNVNGGFGHRVFAFSNLGGHVAPLCLSGFLLHQQQQLISWCVVTALSLAAILGARSKLPNLDTHEQIADEGALLLSIKRGRLDCRCKTCRIRYQKTEECCSFIFHGRARMCRLWLLPCEELSDTLLNIAFDAK